MGSFKYQVNENSPSILNHVDLRHSGRLTVVLRSRRDRRGFRASGSPPCHPSSPPRPGPWHPGRHASRSCRPPVPAPAPTRPGSRACQSWARARASWPDPRPSPASPRAPVPAPAPRAARPAPGPGSCARPPLAAPPVRGPPAAPPVPEPNHSGESFATRRRRSLITLSNLNRLSDNSSYLAVGSAILSDAAGPG